MTLPSFRASEPITASHGPRRKMKLPFSEYRVVSPSTCVKNFQELGKVGTSYATKWQEIRLYREARPEHAGEISQAKVSGFNPEPSAESSEMFKQGSDTVQ